MVVKIFISTAIVIIILFDLICNIFQKLNEAHLKVNNAQFISEYQQIKKKNYNAKAIPSTESMLPILTI